jgi:hypothetical protein
MDERGRWGHESDKSPEPGRSDGDGGSWTDSGFDDGELGEGEPVHDEPEKEPGTDGKLPAPVFGSLEQFVTEYLLPVYRRAVSGTGTTWCPEWWRHREALVRLDALWRAWEYQRHDAATGMSVWLRDHADHHMSVLLSADGPLKGCTESQHSSRPLRPLPSTAVPDGFSVQPPGSHREPGDA